MTTGEKIAALRRKKGITQEQLSEILNVSRQSVSRWEMDAAFPETEKLIRLSRLLECSIDFLLNNEMQEKTADEPGISAAECFRFIRECGYFFLATASEGKPRLRPMGMICSSGKALFIATDRRKNVFAELIANPQISLASYNLNSRKWIRISGTAEIENAVIVREDMLALYPMIRQEFVEEDELNFVIFKIIPDQIQID